LNHLTNQCDSIRTRCDDCKDLLTHSNWRNKKVFLSIKSKFLCVRCIDKKIITAKKLDNFVKRQNGGTIPQIPIKPISKKNQLRLNRGHRK
jgi:hypothetical protein